MTESSWQLNGYQVKYVADEAAFQDAIAQLSQQPALALDLEFDDNRYTYGLNLCLIQIADEHTCFLIDPFRIRDLQPLWELIEDQAVVKIIHSASNDILLLKKLGCQPRNILDTELAARMLDYGRTSFANMMAVVLNVEIDKSFQVSNWNKRPLIAEQLLYAANDVVYLHPLKENLLGHIQQLNRQAWLEEECRLMELIEMKDQTERYLKLRGAERLTQFELFVLRQLFDFRENLAFQLNKPSASVIPNEILVNMAQHPVQHFSEWQATKGLMGRIKDNQTFKEVRQVVQQAQQQAQQLGIPHTRPPRPRRPEYIYSREEVEQRKARLQPLRSRLIEIYGENVATILLPSGVVNEYAEGRGLEIRKAYARQIVLDLMAEMQISLD
ncbi:MAG: ribonuclease D [Adhaeribacter sp.]